MAAERGSIQGCGAAVDEVFEVLEPEPGIFGGGVDSWASPLRFLGLHPGSHYDFVL